jgi:hypothetical protein
VLATLGVLARILLTYGALWAVQETAGAWQAFLHDEPQGWQWPSPWNCPTYRDYEWNWPRCNPRHP